MSKQPNYVFDELYHHGILGQRWGHRRFQNEDGSWTQEGRERYSEGDGPRRAAKPKVDARAKVRAAFAEKKFKLQMKSKEQKLKDKIAAKEERNRVREQAKTERLANREQAKLDRKEAVRSGRELGLTKNMSNDDLQTAISRLKLEAEYNKSYALASNPNGLLARADRFFEGPTGQAVKAVAVATLPKVAEQAASKILESNLKYANKLDRDKQKADIEKTKSEAKEKEANARQVERESKNKVILDREKAEREKFESNRKFEQEKLESDREFEQQKKRDQNDYDLNKMDKLHTAAVKKAELKLAQEKQNAEQERLNNKANLENRVKEAEEFGYDPGNILTRSANYVSGRLAWRYGNNGEIAKEQEAKQKENAEKIADKQSERRIKEENAASEMEIRKAEAQTRINEADRIQQNIQYMAQHGIPGSAEYARNASGALRATINIMSNPEVHNKPASSLASLPSITSGTESRIKSLRSSGKTLREIAETMNMPTSTVASVFYDIKI